MVRRRTIVMTSIVAGLVILGAAGGILLATLINRPASVTIPKQVAEQLLFPTYLPEPLPEGYRIPDGAFRVQEGVLLFYAINNEGKKINFAEQAKPRSFDFTAFYQQQLSDIRNLQDAPHSSVLGKTEEGITLLSVTTDKTWLLINSRNAPDADLRFIAEHLKGQ